MKYPSFFAWHGRKPEPGKDYNPDSDLCQDDYEYLTGTGRYSNDRPPIKGLTCCCCGEATRGRQHYNRDTGFGLCPKCAQWIATRETSESMEENYGVAGFHYAIKEEEPEESKAHRFDPREIRVIKRR